MNASNLISSIISLRSLEENWDGSGARAPFEEAIETAIQFVETHGPMIFDDPALAVADDGEVSLYWAKPTIQVDVGFVGDGLYYYFAESTDGQRFSSSHSAATDVLPSGLISILNK